VECLIIMDDGRALRSAGWQGYETPPPLALARADVESQEPPAGGGKPDQGGPAVPARPPWNRDFELVVNFEINRPEAEAGRYRRPYIAIWIENKDGFAVRNLALWISMGGSGPFQWLPDLKRWYKSDEARRRVDKTDMVFTIARPTRQPGKYKVIWDGTDDHGKQLGSGEYTVFIDAAREHGTYQSIRKLVTLADKPFTEELKGNVEIKSASIAYRRKPPAK
jgi:FAD:protein FMN transferase